MKETFQWSACALKRVTTTLPLAMNASASRRLSLDRMSSSWIPGMMKMGATMSGTSARLFQRGTQGIRQAGAQGFFVIRSQSRALGASNGTLATG
jgi:hypothetical protein